MQKSFQEGRSEGTLYLVGTPIGNLEDITYRAVRILKEVEWIAAEDTRQTQKLLRHLGISKRLISYHEHNKQKSGRDIVERLQSGQSVALVSDAGLPGISDPGEELVRSAVGLGIPVVPVPGANAALSALIASGLATGSFLFLGFPPRERKKLQALLERYRHLPDTVVFYEAPHRVEKTLEAVGQIWGNRSVVLARELTKRFEEFVRGTVQEALAWLKEHPPQGEFCLVVSGSGEPVSDDSGDPWWQELTVEQHVQAYMQQGLERKEALKKAALDRGVPKREIYNLLLR